MSALEGVKVLDLSRVLAGPWCTQTLADLGADVWKVESPDGDDTRSWLPPDLEGESTYFHCANRSKRSIAVDFRTPQGQEIIRALAARADVVVENFKLGGLEKFGLGAADLMPANPRLIWCTISGYGRTGSRAFEPGYDFAIQAESGLMSITGEAEGQPMKLGVAITDIVAGMNASQAVLAALIARDRSGRGQLIDIALLDSAIGVLANVGSGYLATGKAPRRFGNAHPTVAPYQLFDSADGRFAVAVGNDRQFAVLCRRIIDRPELSTDPRFVTNRARIEHREDLTAQLAQVFCTRATADWLDRFRTAGVPAGAVRRLPEVFAAPEIAERGLVAEVPDPVHGTLRLLTSPLGLRDTPPRRPVTPPRLGEHSDDILRQVLGATPGQIAAWRAAGAVA